ncbi:Probable purine permease 10 [Linum perenne]
MTTQPSEIQLHVLDSGGDDEQMKESSAAASGRRRMNYMWWIKVATFTMLVILGQTVAVLLGRLYFLKGGSSKWISSLVQVAGFPILIPYYLVNRIINHHHQQQDHLDSTLISPITLVSIYSSLGLIIGLNCFLYSVGLQYLPVSTYTLLCSSQLGFNAFFSYFINSHKFNPYVINSLLLLTVSSVLLVFNNDNDHGGTVGPTISRVKYTAGFLCTLAASALYGLLLSLMELVFTKVIKRHTFNHVMDMNILANLVATLVTLVGLFASQEWKGLGAEMDAYGQGTVSYCMTLICIAVFWQLFFVGVVGLVFQVSSLFSNSISVVGSSLIPIMAVFFFKDNMSGVKGVSMVLSVWGFVSYVYPYYYVDHDHNSKDDHITSLTSVDHQPGDR